MDNSKNISILYGENKMSKYMTYLLNPRQNMANTIVFVHFTLRIFILANSFKRNIAYFPVSQIAEGTDQKKLLQNAYMDNLISSAGHCLPSEHQ